MAQSLITFILTLTAALASANLDIPLEVIPIEDAMPIEPALPPINTPEPLLLPMIANCEQFHLVSPGETCDSIASSLGMSIQDLGALNPFIGSDGKECARGLLAGYWCCVKARGQAPAAPNQPVQVPGPMEAPPKFVTQIRDKLNTEAAKRTSTQAPRTKTVTVPPPKPTEEESRAGNPNWDITECKWTGKNCPQWKWP
jgi:hypothetical protein